MIKSVNMNRNQRKYGFVICNLFFLISKEKINKKRKKYTGIRFNYFLLFNLFPKGIEQTRDYKQITNGASRLCRSSSTYPTMSVQTSHTSVDSTQPTLPYPVSLRDL